MSTTTDITEPREPAGGGSEAGEPAARAGAYLAEVRHHLDGWAGLSGDERDELIDELTAHVHEVAASDGRPLDELLGTPRGVRRRAGDVRRPGSPGRALAVVLLVNLLVVGGEPWLPAERIELRGGDPLVGSTLRRDVRRRGRRGGSS